MAKARTMTLTEHDRTEFLRAAQSLYDRGESQKGAFLFDTARRGLFANGTKSVNEIPLKDFDRAKNIYREWLVFDTPKGRAAPKKNPRNRRIGSVKLYRLPAGRSNKYRAVLREKTGEVRTIVEADDKRRAKRYARSGARRSKPLPFSVRIGGREVVRVSTLKAARDLADFYAGGTFESVTVHG